MLTSLPQTLKMKKKLIKYARMLEEERKRIKRKEMREKKKMFYYLNKKVNFQIISLLYGEVIKNLLS
jgi:ABC-type transport system involved in Fe-S cluster assembly fused permease/ATPase subunit